MTPPPASGEPSASFGGATVLVTGGAGFIGSHLVDALLERGARVRVLDNLVSGSRDNLHHCADSIELLEGDIRDAEMCCRACDQATYVFHQAALGSIPRSLENPAESVAVNVSGTANIFLAAHRSGVRRVIYASSSSVYGDSEELPKREGREGAPLSPYAASKQMTEQLAGVYANCFGQQLIGLRYFNIFGPRQSPEGPYAAVIPRFFQACLRGTPPVIYGDGEQSRDFTYVGDAAGANLLAALAPDEACGAAYNVSSGRSVSVRSLLAEIQKLLGTELEPVQAPPRAGDVAHSAADLTESAARLAYRPGNTLAEGLEASHEYYAAILRTT